MINHDPIGRLPGSPPLTPGHPLRYARIVVGRGKRSPGGRRVLAGIADEILIADAPLARRSSTEGAENGFVDIWHRERWPRVRRIEG